MEVGLSLPWLQKLGVQALRLAGVQVCKTRPTYTYTKYTAFAQSPDLTPPYPRPHPLGPPNPALNHVWALKRPDTGYMPIRGLLAPPSFYTAGAPIKSSLRQLKP